MRARMPAELNHIFTNPRRDVTAAVITLSKLSHDWFHANIKVGRMLCMLVKFRKGEADVELWDLAYGKRAISLLSEPECLDSRYERFRNELIRWFGMRGIHP